MAEVTAGLKDIAGAGRRHYIWLVVLVLLGLFLAVRYHVAIANFLARTMPASVLKLFGLTAIAATFVVLFLSGAAEAATCCAKPLVDAVASSGWLSHAWTVLAGVAGAGVLGVVAFPAPDVIEAKLGDGNKVVNYTPATGVSPSYDFFVNGSVNVTPDGRRPLCATDQVIELTTTIEQVSTGTNPITDDDLARLVKRVVMHGDPLGTIQDETIGTGPIIKHLLEFIGLGFNRGTDTPVATLTVPQSSPSDATYTRYYTIPHAQRFLANPIISALWIGIINQLKISVTIDTPACLVPVSTNSVTKSASTLRVCTPVVPNSAWHWPVLAQWILETPAGGSSSFTLRRFGESNASGSNPVDWVHTIAYLSSKVGLGGNQLLSNIASISSPKLGIHDMQNVPQFFKARLEAQRYGKTSQSLSDDPNYVQGAVATGMNLADAKFLSLKQPGLDMIMDNMLPVAKGYELPIDFTYVGATPSTAHAVAIGSLRFLSPAIGGRLASLPNSKLSANPNIITLAV